MKLHEESVLIHRLQCICLVRIFFLLFPPGRCLAWPATHIYIGDLKSKGSWPAQMRVVHWTCWVNHRPHPSSSNEESKVTNNWQVFSQETEAVHFKQLETLKRLERKVLPRAGFVADEFLSTNILTKFFVYFITRFWMLWLIKVITGWVGFHGGKTGTKLPSLHLLFSSPLLCD